MTPSPGPRSFTRCELRHWMAPSPAEYSAGIARPYQNEEIQMATTTAEVSTRTAYRIKAREMEMCNCEYNCNCQFGGFPNNGACEFLMGLHITDGHFGDVSLDGVRVAIAAKYPKAIHEGDGHVVVFVDENASPEQVGAIATIFTGQAGGMPWEALAGTVTRLEGPIQKPIEMTFL